ncbi:uncharacterized protein LOC117169540 [Belonocnema kinseyi]|uniref:uncharacterized protein LOC117169540 n=1 Tax=Belonocnema kinseyi TaxID=2817044 RepID=UPI00143DFA38|nr:uncharacterized protein LOC117169540 [Belonocnema kinseyi]
MAHSGKTSHEGRRAISRQRTGSDSNEVEELSEYSFEVESADYLKHTSTPQRRDTMSREFVKEINTSEDTGEDTSDIIRSRRRSSLLENKTNWESRKASHEFRSDGVFNHEEIESPEILEKKRKRRLSRRRRSGNRSLELSKDPEENRKRTSSRARRSSTLKSGTTEGTERSRRKGKRFQGEGEEVELPIAEILKKAQQNKRTKYEEPIPLTELTSDTIYVQGRNGFSAMKIRGGRSGSASRKKVEKSAGSYSHPIRVAIMVQKVWRCTGFIYQGLLAGMAFMHFILLQTYFDDSSKFLLDYSLICEIYTNIFSFLIIMCIIAIFDKFDLAHLDGDNLREIYINEAKSAVAIPLYLITFCLHQVSLRVDDKLSLIYYNASDSGINETALKSFTNVEVPLDEMMTWQRMTLSKDVLAVLAWLFVSLGTRDDMLLVHIETMEKYAENLPPTR